MLHYGQHCHAKASFIDESYARQPDGAWADMKLHDVVDDASLEKCVYFMQGNVVIVSTDASIYR